MRLGVFLVALLASQLAVAQTGGSQSAFEAGKSLGQGKNQGTFSGITGGSAQNKVPRYGANAPESSYFAGGRGETSGPGVGKIQSCASYAPGTDKVANQECEAVNFLARNPNIRPRFTIGQNDPMVQKYRQIRDNAEQIFAQYFPGGTGTQSQCVTRNETIPGQYSDEICVSAQEVETRQCTVGRVINIDADANFQCEQTINAYENLTCRKKISCTGGGEGCYPSGIKTNSVSITGFGRFLLHRANSTDYYLSVGTITPSGDWVNNYDFNGTFYNVFESNIYFTIEDVSNIATFYLDQILYDDNIAVWLNNRLIFHSTGGKDLYRCQLSFNYGVDDGIHACSSSYFEGGQGITAYNGNELKQYLFNGVNHIKIKVAIGKDGDAIARFRTRAYCPLNCVTENQCQYLESMAM